MKSRLAQAQKAAAAPPQLAGVKPRPVQSAAVIGSGTMGAGIAMCFAEAGIPVALHDTSQEALDRALASMRKTWESAAKKERISPQDALDFSARVSAETRLDNDSMRATDLVVEAVFENMAVKKGVFAELDKVCKESATLATNTSTLNVDEIFADVRNKHMAVGGRKKHTRARNTKQRHEGKPVCVRAENTHVVVRASRCASFRVSRPLLPIGKRGLLTRNDAHLLARTTTCVFSARTQTGFPSCRCFVFRARVCFFLPPTAMCLFRTSAKISSTLSVEVLVASVADSLHTLSSSAKTPFFTAMFSNTASTTRSVARILSLSSLVSAETRALKSSASWGEIRSFFAALSHVLRIDASARSRASWLVSCRATGMPASAKHMAMPAPIVPEPMTAADCTGRGLTPASCGGAAAAF